MTSDQRLPPLLYGLFHHLVESGVAVGIRDYLDGVRALERGLAHTDRDGLRALAVALWARSDVERRLIGRWFDSIPLPDAAMVADVDAALPEVKIPDVPREQSDKPVNAVTKAGAGPLSTSAPGPSSTRGRNARLSFASPTQGDGLSVPRLDVALELAEHYVLQPYGIVSQRELAVLWRRYRRATRSGPAVELDVSASISQRCRRGLLERPVLRPRRSNSARLLVLADASPSMDPWSAFLSTLAASLPLSRLASSELHYFSNLPHKSLFATPALHQALDVDTILRRNAGSSLMVISDAGSARGYLNRRRFVQTSRFLELAHRYFPAIVWFNPMPASRWERTTASLVAKTPGITMLPLDAPSLLRGIDVLRGKK